MHFSNTSLEFSGLHVLDADVFFSAKGMPGLYESRAALQQNSSPITGSYPYCT